MRGARRQHGRWFALVNRIHWLCRLACANRIRARAAFPPLSVPRFALVNRIHWLCRLACANRTGARAAFPPLSVPRFALVNRIHWLCRQACANRIRARHRCWRGPTKGQGLAGCTTPTWKAARREKGAGVGAARRRNKGLRGARRQHERPRAGKKAPGLARSDEGTRACGVQGANMNGRPALFKAHCWRGQAVEQGLAGCKAPTCPVTRGRNRNRKRAAAAALFFSLSSFILFRQKCSFQ